MKTIRQAVLVFLANHFLHACFGALALLAWQCASLPAVAQVQFTGPACGSQVLDQRKPTLAVQYAICYQGIYPDRNNTGLQQVDRTQPMVGEIRVFSFNSVVPAGYLPCQGQILSLSQYTLLFSIFGFTY